VKNKETGALMFEFKPMKPKKPFDLYRLRRNRDGGKDKPTFATVASDWLALAEEERNVFDAKAVVDLKRYEDEKAQNMPSAWMKLAESAGTREEKRRKKKKTLKCFAASADLQMGLKANVNKRTVVERQALKVVVVCVCWFVYWF
jgi:hypothetical protein